MQNVGSVINSYKVVNPSGASPLDTQTTWPGYFGGLVPLAVLCLLAVDVEPV